MEQQSQKNMNQAHDAKQTSPQPHKSQPDIRADKAADGKSQPPQSVWNKNTPHSKTSTDNKNNPDMGPNANKNDPNMKDQQDKKNPSDNHNVAAMKKTGSQG